MCEAVIAYKEEVVVVLQLLVRPHEGFVGKWCIVATLSMILRFAIVTLQYMQCSCGCFTGVAVTTVV